MPDNLRFALAFAAALGCGLNAGVFFAFSAFVMRALGRLPAAQGVAAMQAINVAAVRPPLMAALFGTAAACVALAAAAPFAWHRPGSGMIVAGAVLYLAGTVGVTFVCNVPRNNALAAVDATTPEAAGLWARYLSGWTAWNHVRTVAALAAAACFTGGLCAARAGAV